MSSEQFSHVEQDHSIPKGGDELPTYDDLAAQSGPNSRFGRWRGWIEKRAAERYIDITPEERARRRERGWGNEDPEGPEGEQSSPVSIILSEPPTPSLTPTPTPMATNLHIQTNDLNTLSLQPSQPGPPRPPSPPLPLLPFVSQKLTPTHLKMIQFGSRFLPHTTSPIRCLLPLLSDKLLLIGHDEGLSVLDMFPQEWTETGGIAIKGPDEAQARLIWRGESVHQMSILETENTGEGTPQGVVLILVGPEPGSPTGKDQESLRTLRMYNLGSLISLAKWAVAQRGTRPLDLHWPSNWHAQQTPIKKHRHQRSITQSLKSLIESPASQQTQEPSSYQSLLVPTPSQSSNASVHSSGVGTPNRNDSDESSWDMVDDLPLRWATDFVPLATAGSRLVNTSVLSYALWRNDDNRVGRGGQLLAIATKNNILLYETPKGERAFRFVKEFYTPLQPRKITFFQQSVQDVVRSTSSVSMTPGRYQAHTRSDSVNTLRGGGHRNRTSSVANNTLNYGTQLTIFVSFEKKAGWIRLADSAVGEMDMYDDGAHTPRRDSLSPGATHNTIRKSRLSLDVPSGAGKWVLPTRCELPVPASFDRPASTRTVHLVTRGKKTHIVRSPLPVNSSAYPPLRVVTWQSAPTHVSSRVCHPSSPDMHGMLPYLPYLQLVALGEDGVEVQEISLSFLTKGKGKAQFEVSLTAEEDLGGDTGFLCLGGNWDDSRHAFHPSSLSRTSSDTSGLSFNSMESEDMAAKTKREEGIYGWCRKGTHDWRVFWVGGAFTDTDPDKD